MRQSYFRKTILAIIIGFSAGFFLLSSIDKAESEDTAQLRRRNTGRAPDFDNFISHWQNSKSEKLYGSFEKWDILTSLKGDPLAPTHKGAVLVDLNSVSYAELKAFASMRPVTLDGCQQIWYINSGQGVIETKRKTAELFEGVGVIVPPDIEFTVTNTGDDKLSVYIVEEPVHDWFTPKTSIVVKYEYDNKISTNISRVNGENWLFSREDGLSVLVAFNPMMYEPKSIVPLHVHEPGVEEVWIGIKGDMEIQFGRQRRPFPEGSAYKVPANGFTPHTNINGTDVSKKLIWMMKVPLPPGYDSRTRSKDVI